MATVLDLTAADADLSQVGGKALNLGVLLRAGFPVPHGFCVTTAAYDQVVGDRLDTVVISLAEVSPGDSATIGALSAEAREAIRGIPVPEEMAEEIRQAYAALGQGVPVAVRSSATAED